MLAVKMYQILLLVLFFTIDASEQATVKCRSFSILDSIYSFADGVSNLAEIFNHLGDIFNVIQETPTKVLNTSVPVPEDAYLNISQLITKYGYKFEGHNVTTEDGHILGVHRLLAKNKKLNGKVVFLMHGILDSSDSWILQGPNNSLGYILADNGFDVWMGNARGNKHSLSHATLQSNDSDFWEFTWEEIGTIDLPSMIDYVLNTTKHQHLYYIGHSQGTTTYYVLNSMKPEYNNKVKLMFSLAPVAWMAHAKSPIARIFSPAYKVLSYLLSNFNQYTSSSDFFNRIAPMLCTILPSNCNNIVHMIIGSDMSNINSSLVPVIFGHLPTGSSTSQFVHYGQLVKSERFCRFDFDAEMNMKFYGQKTPPEYDLSKIKLPIYLFYSDQDWLSDPRDVFKLQRNLPNVQGNYMIEGFSHFDFMYSSKAKGLIYDRIMEEIETDNVSDPQVMMNFTSILNNIMSGYIKDLGVSRGSRQRILSQIRG